MAITAYTVFADNDVLFASQLNLSFAQIINNPIDLWSPMPKSAAGGGFKFTGMGNATATGEFLTYGQGLTGTTGAFSGAVTALTWNGVTITAPAASATLTIANTKTLTASNTLTLAGTDATTMTFPTASTTFGWTTYTPTLTNGTNVAASTARLCRWIRLGNTVLVAGSFDVDPTAAGGAQTILSIELPVASNLGATTDLSGTAVSAIAAGGTTSDSGLIAMIQGDASNDRAILYWNAGSSNNITASFMFMYTII